MKTVYLHGKLGKRFGRKWKLAVRSPIEAFSAIEANQEGFLAYMLEKEKAGTKYFALNKKPSKIKDKEDLEASMVTEGNVELGSSSSEFHVIPKVKGETGFLEIALIKSATGATILSVGQVVIPMAISFVVGAIMKAMNKPPKRSDPTTTKSYLLKGGQNRQAQGVAVPLGYGRLKIGSTNLSEKTVAHRAENMHSLSKNPSSLQSFSELEYIDLLCEGPIEGFADQNGNLIVSEGGERPRIERGVFLNNVPIENTPTIGQVGTSNYILNEKNIMPSLKYGAEGEEFIISDECFSLRKYDTVIYGAAPYGGGDVVAHSPNIDNAISNGAKVVSHYVGNPEVSKVTLNMRAELSATNMREGSTHPTELRFAVLIDKDHEEKNINDLSSRCKVYFEGNASAISIKKGSDGYMEVKGIATASYEFSVTIEYDAPKIKSKGATFKIIRLSRELDPTVKDSPVGGINKTRVLQLSSVTEFIREPMLYPHSAMVKVLFDSKNFQSLPERSYHVRMKKVVVPSNYNPLTREYDGPWNGLFKGQADSDTSIHSIPDSEKVWTDNPAWVFYDLLYNARYGVGKFGLDEENIDKWQLYNISKYCDELVETEYPIETPFGLPLAFTKTSNSTIQISPNQFGSTSRHVANFGIDAFKRTFGSGNSFAGKSVVLFISSSGSLHKSIKREGEIIMREFKIVESISENMTVVLSGAEGFLSTLGSGEVGSCATQINHPIVEPRFTANLYLTDRSEALSVINNLASIFRGITAYSSGKIIAMQDSFKNPVALFNNSNVSEDGFMYSGPNKDQKSTAVLVRFNNKDNNFLPEVAYEEDADSMQRLGYQEEEILGLGITSSTQARRAARWALNTMQLEIETVSFQCGAEASYLFPGAVFEVSDEIRSGKTKSGRVLNVENGRVLLDKNSIDQAFVGQIELSVCVGMSRSSTDIVEQRSSFEGSERDQDAEIESSLAPQVIKFEGNMILNLRDYEKGPRGQSLYASNLRVKFPVEVDLESNVFTSFSHGFDNGDSVEFLSQGVLPAGISKRAYFVIDKTIHTFRVTATQGSTDAVNVLDTGLDPLGNRGGAHYVAPYSASSSKNSEYLNKIPIGAPWSAKGSVATLTQKQLSQQGAENLGIVRGFSDYPKWYSGSWLGDTYLDEKANADWIYASSLWQWVYVAEMNKSQNGEFWFHIGSGLGGWFFTTESLKRQFWYSHAAANAAEQVSDGTEGAGWVIPYYVGDNLIELFIYDSSAGGANSLSVGDSYKIGDAERPIVEVYSSGSVKGYFINLDGVERGNRDVLSSNVSGEASNPNDVRSNNPFRKEKSIASIEAVDAHSDILSQAAACGENCIRITLDPVGAQVSLTHNMEIHIEGVESTNQSFVESINNVYVKFGNDFEWRLDVKPWRIYKISDTVFELIGSEHLHTIFNTNSNISASGKISIIESFGSEVSQKIESQLFRTMSVKEMSEGKYEVAGLEYNQGKFNAVDKKTVVRRPIIPIPPQADMSIPEPPESLILTDLSN